MKQTSGIEYLAIARLNDNPDVMTQALGAHVDLRRQGWTDLTSLTGQERAVIAWEPDRAALIGLIAWTEDDEEPVWWRNITWVDPGWRGEGIVGRLHAEMLRLAQEENVLRIEGGCHVNNTAMIRAFDKAGYVNRMMCFTLEVHK